MRSIFISFLILIFSSHSYALTGYSEDYMVQFDLDTEMVREWLPDRVTIDNDGPTHKVLINFGLQRGVAYMPPYYEISVKVTGVRFRDADPEAAQRYQFYKVLYMNNWSAVKWGIALYDSPKKYADAVDENGVLSFLDKDSGEPIFEAAYRQTATRRVDLDHPNVREFADNISGPRMTYKKGRYKCWDTSAKNVELIPYEMDVTIHPEFFDNMELPHHQSFGAINESSFGTFMELSKWRFFKVSCD